MSLFSGKKISIFCIVYCKQGTMNFVWLSINVGIAQTQPNLVRNIFSEKLRLSFEYFKKTDIITIMLEMFRTMQVLNI